MGDTNNYQQEKDQQQQHYAGAGMDALISAIEYQGRSTSAQSAGGYPVMASTQDHKIANHNAMMQQEEAEKLRAAHFNSQVAAAAAAGLYSNLPAFTAGMSNPLWGLNHMLMFSQALPGLRPGLGVQSHANLLSHGGVPGLPHMVHDREIPGQSDCNSFLGRNMDGSSAGKHSELSGLPFWYQGLPYLYQQGLAGVPVDKVPSVHDDTAANGMQYPSPVALSQYLGMPGYNNFLTGNAAGMLPSMLPGGLSPAALGALSSLGAHPYYQSSLGPRMPFLTHGGQNPMMRMPLNPGLNTSPSRSHSPEACALRPESPRVDQRPQSGGYLPMKEGLERRLSAPHPGTGPHFRIPPMRNNGLGRVDKAKPGSSYSTFPHRTPHFTPTAEPHPRTRAVIDPKSIEQRISQIISQNEKILLNPSLDKVKPRRVFRRNSLDPASLSSPTPTHNPLTATHSAPRSLDPKYYKSLLKSTSTERPNYLSVPSRLTESQNGSQSSKPMMTVIPDPRRDPNARPFIPAYTTTESRHAAVADVSTKDSGQLLERPGLRHRESYQCVKCGAIFSKQDTLNAHQTGGYCDKMSHLSSPESSTPRQSVIQYTSVPSGDDTPQGVPKVKVTPPEMEVSESPMNVKVQRSKLLENPMRRIHKDLHRTQSADAAFQIPHKLRESSLLPNSPLVKSPGPKIPYSPSKSESTVPPNGDYIPSCSRSSIPTDKLPPKKKQLQLMRSSSSNKSQLDCTRSPSHIPSPLTSDLSPSSQETKTPDESSPPQPAVPTSMYQRQQPPMSLPLDSMSSRKSLPPWIPLEREENGGNGVIEPPSICLSNPSRDTAFPQASSSILPSPTGAKSPTSPKSPSRRMSPSRGSRSPSRSPTSSNLESTVPRSNYKLLLHQLSLRNIQDMGYLSEAYHHSKDKNLKRNIASLLWSSAGSHSSGGGSSSKRTRPFGPADVPNMEELYPGKASLARRLSPDARSTRLQDSSSLSLAKIPLSQSRSRPYESTLKAHPSVTRSHSDGHSTDVNNNIKQFLYNKSRIQQQQAANSLSTSQPTKGHKPLTRTHANARYLLKSPTKPDSSEMTESTSGLAGKTPPDARIYLPKVPSNSTDSMQRLKDSLALKRASSYNPDATVDYQSKRQKLIPIPNHPTTNSHTMLPTSLVASRLTEHIPTTPEVKDLPKIKSINLHTVQTPFLLHPHCSPSLGYEPHTTFCSLVSPQPMYAESTVSMYSQWAVKEPLLLPEGMTVADILENMRFLKALSPYTSHNSLYTTPVMKEGFKLTDTKDYEAQSKKQDTESKQKPDKTGSTKSEPVGSNQSEPVGSETISVDVEEVGVEKNVEDRGDQKDQKDWMFSQMIPRRLMKAPSCYTSCHNKTSTKSDRNSPATSKTTMGCRTTKYHPDLDSKSVPMRFPKLPPPRVIIHPPSPESDSQEDVQNSSPHNNDITAIELSDSDTDSDDVINEHNEPFLKLDISPSSPPRRITSSPPIITPFVTSPTNSPPAIPINLLASAPSGEIVAEFAMSDTSPTIPSLDIPINLLASAPSGEILEDTVMSVTSTANPPTDSPICSLVIAPSGEILEESVPSVTSKDDDKSKNDPSSDYELQSPLQIDENDAEPRPNGGSVSPKDCHVSHRKISDQSQESGNSEEGKGESSKVNRKKHKKIRRSRKERNATSPRLQKRLEGSPESPLGVLEDPNLAVHPIGACSDDPAKICALCRMKAGGSKPSTDAAEKEDDEAYCNGKCETTKNDESDSAIKPASPSLGDRPEAPNRPHTPTAPRVRIPISNRPKTPVPLTVSVPKRSRDRTSSKSGKQPLTPGILDKARGKGTTQHWVTTSDLQTSQPSPKQDESGNEDKDLDSQTEIRTEKPSITKNRTVQAAEYFSSMPPNKNPVLEHNLQQNTPETTPITPVTSANGGLQALAAVVSGVMRSAAIQSKKKTKISKHEMTELLSHSRPLIPTSELNGPASKAHVRFTEKQKSSESETNADKNSESSLGSLANLTATVGPTAAGGRGKPSLRHLSLSSRETELFLNKANEARTTIATPSLNERKIEAEMDEFQDADEEHHSDSAKEDSPEADGESSNPRPHKCLECKVAFRIAGHLAKHLRSKGHIIAMQKKTLNRLKQQKLTSVTGQEVTLGGQGVNVSGSMIVSAGSPEAHQPSNQEEFLTQLGEGAETLAQSQVRALFEGNEEYAEINTGIEGGAEAVPETSDDEGEYSAQCGSSDPRPFKCIACKVAFRFQGHLDRHFRSNTHLLAVGHFGRDAISSICIGNSITSLEEHLPARTEDSVTQHEITQNAASPLSDDSIETSKALSMVQNCDYVIKEINFDKITQPEVTLDEKCCKNADVTSTQLVGSSDQNEVQQLDNKTVNQELNDSDWSKESSIKLMNQSNHPKEPINGLNTHSLPDLPETSKSDSLIQMSIKRQSPAVQSSPKTMFETTPTIPEMPLPSTSPVQKRQQLTA